ncbi:UDP-glucose 4-epimerase GalE [Akkermansiaceae bacterium]|nr:UDP-glucose 4-epimerase GalE [Akkermansiaceae bacterium]MDA7868326.1 UDP-glucose 4-epimerase GalE [bacterium]MDA7892224.1 UDP-glucose 4-epimerase GalE [Akkermansiaceae bacterium]MDA7907590.1 UDP-glucose 4-epimerase GalE [Akkermansiaceae bacterium]MDA7929338.1 UDP-glucose 4-epimerase GalE [Akkermansiaceae bacterium]
MSGESVLVTGGAGYIGSHTVRLLCEEGYRVIVLDNLVYGHVGAIVDDSAELVVGDVGDRELLTRLFTEHNFTGVIHFAAYAYVGESVTNPLKYYRNNTAEPLTLLEVMSDFGCKSLVFSSTCATYGEPEKLPLTEDHSQNPVSPYGKSKLMVEWILDDCDVAWDLKSVALRYFNASGCSTDGLIGEDHSPETHLIPLVLQAVKGEIPEITVFGTDYPTDDGTCIRDYIHVEDLATAHLAALRHLAGGGDSLRCNLGTGVGISVKQIIDIAEEVTGQKVPVKYGDRRPGDPGHLVADPGNAKKFLDWEASSKDPRSMIETAWKWMSQPHGGHFPG